MSPTEIGGPALRPLHLGARRGLSLVRGDGCTLFDSDGRAHLDLASNYGVNVLGHAHPAVTEAIAAQAAVLTSAHQSFDSPVRERFLATLGTLVPAALSRVCLVNSGAEAVEVAIKLARAATGRTRLVAMHRGYHGRTLGALSLTAGAAYRDCFGPLVPGVVHIPFDDIAALELVDDAVAAVVVEPIQGEAGVRVPQQGYLRAVRRRCSEVGALLVADEVQTGLRTGAMLAGPGQAMDADIVCLGKGLANGLPMAVTLCTEAVAASFPRGGHGSTYAGNPLVCAAGAATLAELAEPGLHAAVALRGAEAMRRLRARLPEASVRDVRGRGLLIGIEFRRPVSGMVMELQRRGILVLQAGRTVIRLLPPLIIDATSLDTGIDAVCAVAAEGW